MVAAMTSAITEAEWPLRVRDLGFVAIDLAGEETELNGQAALALSLLASRYPDAVSRQTFFDVLWGQEDDGDRSNNLRVLIHRLRRLLGSSDVLPFSDEAYRLAVLPEQLDSIRFVRLVEAAASHQSGAQFDAARRSLDEALALWRGSVAGAHGHEDLHSWQAYLETMRLDAEDDWLQAMLDGGDEVAAAAEARRLVDAQPYRERRWELLMLSLYRSGRQQEALDAAAQVTSQLRTDLGVNPGPSLRQLELDILEQAAHLDFVGSRGVELPLLPAVHGGVALGREEESTSVNRLCHERQLVTIVGPGGIGKTHLALCVAHELTAEDSEVWWCDLAAVRANEVAEEPRVDRDRSEVALRVGVAAGLTNGSDRASEVAQVLSHRSAVTLVLDNCEHVLGDVRALIERLCAADNITVLATSRRPLDLAAESVVRLGSLPPDAAAELFTRVAQAAAPAAPPLDLELVHRICGRVDGMPLAIELVARRVRSFSLSEIDGHLHSLVHDRGASDPSDRHATMTTALAWSSELLSQSGRVAAGAAAVFPGSFDLTAFGALVQGRVEASPLLVLEELVDHGLLQVVQGEEITRYRMLQPIREHAAMHLADDSHLDRDRHLEHYLHRLEVAYAAQTAESSDSLTDLILHELHNLALVHEWALESGRLDDGLRLYRPLTIAHLHDRPEPFLWALETIALPTAQASEGFGAALHAAWYGSLAVQMDVATASTLVAKLAVVEPTNRSYDLAQLAVGLHALLVEHDYDTAEAQFSNVSLADPYVRYVATSVGASVRLLEATRRGDDPTAPRSDASEHLAQGLQWARSIGAKNFEAGLLERQAQLLVGGGRLDEARSLATKAQQMAADLSLGHVHAQAQFQLVRCDLAQERSGPGVAHRLADALDSAVYASAQARLRWQLPVAAQVFIANQVNDVAALCLVASGFAAGAAEAAAALSEAQVAEARALASGRSLLDIATEAVRRLRDLDTPLDSFG